MPPHLALFKSKTPVPCQDASYYVESWHGKGEKIVIFLSKDEVQI